MLELTPNVPILSTLQELEQAIQEYITSDLSREELLRQWQAIRDASLKQEFSQIKSDKVPGEDSY